MDINNFVQILIDALTKKERLLEEILKLCKAQEECIKKDVPDLNEYVQCSDKKAELSKLVEKVDEGFLAVYDRVKDELESNPTQYAEYIRRMKSLVTAISEKTASVSVTEQRLNVEFKKRVGNSGAVNSGSARVTGNAAARNVNSNSAVQAYGSNATAKYVQTMNGKGAAAGESTFINTKQ